MDKFFKKSMDNYNLEDISIFMKGLYKYEKDNLE